MKRKALLAAYAALWVYVLALILVFKPPVRGMTVTFLLYGPPVFILYLVSVFLLDCRRDEITAADMTAFVRRRRVSILLFLFSLVVLVVLVFMY